MHRAIVLLSGGLDSSTVLVLAKGLGYACHALGFDYGQRHAVELQAAGRVAECYEVPLTIVQFNMRALGGSAITADILVPTHPTPGIPITYVPARNTIFLAFALAHAEVLGATDIFIGVNAVDYSGYPDCRPEYIQAFQQLAKLATKAGVEGGHAQIHAPLQHMTKAQIIAKGLSMGVDYALTSSCYDPAPEGACGACDSCWLRLKGFAENGTSDPICYR